MVQRRLIECLSRDRTKHQVAEVTSLGLVQMTRKKLGIGLIEAFSEPCEACASRGIIVHHEPIMRTKHVANDEPAGKQNQNQKQGKGKKKEKKIEVAKVVTPERAVELGSVITKIAASTAAAHEAAGEPSPIVVPASAEAETETEASNILDSVVDALPEPKGPGEGKRKPRSRRGSNQ